MSVRRSVLLCGAAGALLAARVSLVVVPGRALRWGSRIAGHDFTGRRSRGSRTGRGSRGSNLAFPAFFPWVDPRDPRLVENPRAPRPATDARIRDLSNAVIALAVRRPFSATCLEQSLALVMLFTIARIPAHLVLGVRRAEPTLMAHAWVECEGRVVLGGAHAAVYAPLLGRPADSAPSEVVSSCPG